MNWLAHAVLSPDHPPTRLANLLADSFPKKFDASATPWEDGLRLHVAIDAFTDRDPDVREARRRFPPPWHHASGVISDILFDHFLTKTWDRWFMVSLEEFLRELETCGKVAEHLPEEARGTWESIREYRWLSRYGTWEGLAHVLSSLQRRLRPSRLSRIPLADSVKVMREREAELAGDFARFFPKLLAFVEGWMVGRGMTLGIAGKSGVFPL